MHYFCGYFKLVSDKDSSVKKVTKITFMSKLNP